MTSAFEVLYDLGNLGLPGIEEEEIHRLLDISQYNLINQRLQGQNAYGSKYPDTIKRIDDLSGLIVEDNDDTGTLTKIDGYGNSLIITLPTTYLHLIEDGVRLEYSQPIQGGGDNYYLEYASQISISQAQRFIGSKRNGVDGPYIKKAVYHFIQTSSGQRQIVIYPSTDNGLLNSDIDKILCLYIKKPTDLTNVGLSGSTDLTDFNNDVYYEIVKMAVNEAVAIASPQKIQVSQNQVIKSE
jgi:hypothetical protein